MLSLHITHKVLRGPRGGIILTNNEELIKKFNSAIFPGLQGGPLMHVIASKAVCFKEVYLKISKLIQKMSSIMQKFYQTNY